MTRERYDPESSRDRLLAAVQQERWLPILQPPFDPSEEDPRFEEALEPAREILGRLAIALHVAYEEACKPGFPLLLSDRPKEKVQYAIKDTDPGFYHLVFFRGKEEQRQRFCSIAKVVLTPELGLEQAKGKFLRHPRNEKDREQEVYDTYFEDSYSSIRGATRSILVEFNKGYQIRSISADCAKDRKSYYFLGVRDLRIEEHLHTYHPQTKTMTLNRDGIFRYDDGTTREVDLAGELLEITSQLPIEHHIR